MASIDHKKIFWLKNKSYVFYIYTLDQVQQMQVKTVCNETDGEYFLIPYVHTQLCIRIVITVFV